MYTYLLFPSSDTGWRRLIGSPKLQIIFHKRAIKYRALVRQMTYQDKGSYESSPPCMYIYIFSCSLIMCTCIYIHPFLHHIYVILFFICNSHPSMPPWLCIHVYIFSLSLIVYMWILFFIWSSYRSMPPWLCIHIYIFSLSLIMQSSRHAFWKGPTTLVCFPDLYIYIYIYINFYLYISSLIMWKNISIDIIIYLHICIHIYIIVSYYIMYINIYLFISSLSLIMHTCIYVFSQGKAMLACLDDYIYMYSFVAFLSVYI